MRGNFQEKIHSVEHFHCSLNLSNKDFQVAIETLVQLYPVGERFLCFLQIAAQKLAVG